MKFLNNYRSFARQTKTKKKETDKLIERLDILFQECVHKSELWTSLDEKFASQEVFMRDRRIFEKIRNKWLNGNLFFAKEEMEMLEELLYSFYTRVNTFYHLFMSDHEKQLLEIEREEEESEDRLAAIHNKKWYQFWK